MASSSPNSRQKIKRNMEMHGSSDKDCLRNHVELAVIEAEKRANGTLNIREYFTVYLIETKVTDESYDRVSTNVGTIWRRYTDFEQLRSYLEATYPYLVVPPLPEKKVMYSWNKTGGDTMDPDFIERRRVALELFLNRVAGHPPMCFDAIFIGFLQQEEGWRDSCKDTGYLQLTEAKLKSLAPVSIKKLDEQFEAIKDFANELEGILHNVLRVRAKLAERIFIIHKLHANYGRVLSEWSAIEKQMGDGLQKAGHFMDSYAAEIDSLLEEEEAITDQLKEYLFFASSLQAMCRRRDLLQLHLEKAQALLEYRVSEKEAIAQGKSGFISRLLGSVDSDEVREQKVSSSESRIQESKSAVQAAQQELCDFTREALCDYDRWQEQKNMDIRNTLQQFTNLQVKVAKQGEASWRHFRDGIEAIP